MSDLNYEGAGSSLDYDKPAKNRARNVIYSSTTKNEREYTHYLTLPGPKALGVALAQKKGLVNPGKTYGTFIEGNTDCLPLVKETIQNLGWTSNQVKYFGCKTIAIDLEAHAKIAGQVDLCEYDTCGRLGPEDVSWFRLNQNAFAPGAEVWFVINKVYRGKPLKQIGITLYREFCANLDKYKALYEDKFLAHVGLSQFRCDDYPSDWNFYIDTNPKRDTHRKMMFFLYCMARTAFHTFSIPDMGMFAYRDGFPMACIRMKLGSKLAEDQIIQSPWNLMWLLVAKHINYNKIPYKLANKLHTDYQKMYGSRQVAAVA